MLKLSICLFHSGPRATPTAVCFGNVSQLSSEAAVSGVDWRVSAGWYTQEAREMATQKVWSEMFARLLAQWSCSPKQSHPRYSCCFHFPRPILPISCLCTNLLLPQWTRFNILILTFTSAFWPPHPNTPHFSVWWSQPNS